MKKAVEEAEKIVQHKEMLDFLYEVTVFNPQQATGAICIFCDNESPYLQISYVGMSKKDIITALEKVKSDVLNGRIE